MRSKKLEYWSLPRIPTSSRPPNSLSLSRTVTSKPWKGIHNALKFHPIRDEKQIEFTMKIEKERTWLQRWWAAPRPAQPDPTTTTFLIFLSSFGPPLASVTSSWAEALPLGYLGVKRGVVCAGSVRGNLQQQANDIVPSDRWGISTANWVPSFWVRNQPSALISFPALFDVYGRLGVFRSSTNIQQLFVAPRTAKLDRTHRNNNKICTIFKFSLGLLFFYNLWGKYCCRYIVLRILFTYLIDSLLNYCLRIQLTMWTKLYFFIV